MNPTPIMYSSLCVLQCLTGLAKQSTLKNDVSVSSPATLEHPLYRCCSCCTRTMQQWNNHVYWNCWSALTRGSEHSLKETLSKYNLGFFFANDISFSANYSTYRHIFSILVLETFNMKNYSWLTELYKPTTMLWRGCSGRPEFHFSSAEIFLQAMKLNFHPYHRIWQFRIWPV